MKTDYHADFLEAVIGICAAGKRRGISSMLIARFNMDRERIYRIADPDSREAAYRQFHLKWFCDFGLDDVLKKFTSAVAKFGASLESLTWRKARERRDEGAELYTNAEGVRRAVIALRAERFEDDAALEVFLRHETLHICDMLDPDFGYEPDLTMRGATATQKRLATERYRVLWDVTIDGRLTRDKFAIATPREKYASLLDRAFSFWPAERRSEVLTQLWSGRGVNHALLAEFACDPRGHEHSGPAPGQPCPLCGMPTFDWAGAAALTPLAGKIRGEFPRWSIEQGACGRCAEVYVAAMAVDTSSGS